MSKPIVYLGLSGGVDSAVAAVLLMEQGYEVKPVFLKIWSDEDEKTGQCPWVEDRRDAMAVAAKLHLPLETVDFEKQYKDQVFSYFVKEYKAGRTPNPDILCNEIIKFGAFLNWALEQGADYIATGHHVRRNPESGNDQQTELLRGVDLEKDQSYFLASLNQKQLQHSLFPIGVMTKDEVRQKAADLGLDEVAQKRSTRGICFIGKVDLKEFLSGYTISEPGEILDEEGKVIGTHEGVSYYTIGQRKKLDIPAVSTETKPYFVIAKNAEKNQLICSNREEALLEESIFCEDLHWVSGKELQLPLKCQAKIRYGQEVQECEVKMSKAEPGMIEVKFDQPQRAVAPGQFVVFYDNDRLLGNAVIR
jgi:tRNA-specific 2-thiouridylase